MTVVDRLHRLADALPAVFCAVPVADGLCPELLAACTAHPICGELEPITHTARCLNHTCTGVHAADGQDAWTSEVRHDEESAR